MLEVVHIEDLGWQAWYTAGVIVLMIVALLREWKGPDVVLGTGLALLLAGGIVNVEEALSGFSNEGLLTIAALFVVAQGVQETGGLVNEALRLLGEGKNLAWALVRLMVPTLAVSAFLNNTPVVAMFAPVVRRWATRSDFAPSKLLIPLSYASILGGMCTLIGTSTNLVVSGMMTDYGHAAMGMFEIGRVGLPVAIVGLLFMLTVGRKLLPERRDVSSTLHEEKREYLVEMQVGKGCSLVGQSVAKSGLRHLKGLFLVHVERDGTVIGPVSPTETVLAGDRLLFTGLVSTVLELKTIRGLEPVEDGSMSMGVDSNVGDLRLFEVVVSTSSPLVGVGVRAAGFRGRYDAAVIAVHRAGQRIVSKIGDIVLRAGDTLLLEAPEGFSDRWSHSSHFFLASPVGDVRRVKHEKAPFVLGVLILMVALPTLGVVPMVVSAIGAAVLYVLAGVITSSNARRSIDLTVIVAIAAALGVGKAIEVTNLDMLVAGGLVGAVADLGPWAVLAVIMLLTNVFTELVTNKAAAVLFFPIALSAAQLVGADPRPFMLSVAVAAAASFATPLGYQTNLIVYGPGGYRFADFLKVGIPMNLLAVTVGALAIVLGFGL